MTAMVWLRNYFVSFGDHQPNGELIRVSAPTKREVWAEYKRAQERKNCAFVKCKRFSELWAAIFPEYQLEKYVNVQVFHTPPLALSLHFFLLQRIESFRLSPLQPQLSYFQVLQLADAALLNRSYGIG